jgi:flavin-dependent dehydrogenase
MNLQTLQTDVFIVGGGPAGLAAAIAARQNGFRVTVADSQHPPIDKACGEGLMPGAVAALHSLGIRFASHEATPFRGIRFIDGRSGLHSEATFPQGTGLAVRRTTLHAKLAERAAAAGAELRWGAHVTLLDGERITCDGREVQSRWIVGADGLQSRVRQWAGLQPARGEPLRAAAARGTKRGRFGSRQHFRAAPWSDFVEVYWGASYQVTVTPAGPDEVGVAMTSRNPGMRVLDALREIPALAAHLAGAPPATRERGAPATLRRLPALHRGRVVLIGDASGSVDPVTGEGLGLAFKQALALAEALRRSDLRWYQAAHQRIGRMPRLMSHLILLMDHSPWLRRRALRALAAKPGLFARLLEASIEAPGATPLGLADAVRLGWNLVRPGLPT